MSCQSSDEGIEPSFQHRALSTLRLIFFQLDESVIELSKRFFNSVIQLGRSQPRFPHDMASLPRRPRIPRPTADQAALRELEKSAENILLTGLGIKPIFAVF